MSDKPRESTIVLPLPRPALEHPCQILSFQGIGHRWELLVFKERGSVNGFFLGAYLRSNNQDGHSNDENDENANPNTRNETLSVWFEISIPQIYQSFSMTKDFRDHSDMFGKREAFEMEQVERHGFDQGFVKFKVCVREVGAASDWKPRSNLGSNWRELYELNQNADVHFLVGKRSFFTHLLVLQARVPALAAHCRPGIKIGLRDIDPEVFSAFLSYIYTDEEPVRAVEKYPRQILKLAHRFGSWRLCLFAEMELVRIHLVNSEAALDLLTLADTLSCALLKEASLLWVASDFKAVQRLKAWKRFKSLHLIKEIVAEATSRSPRKRKVLALYHETEKRGLPIIGTALALEKQIKTYDAAVANPKTALSVQTLSLLSS